MKTIESELKIKVIIIISIFLFGFGIFKLLQEQNIFDNTLGKIATTYHNTASEKNNYVW